MLVKVDFETLNKNKFEFFTSMHWIAKFYLKMVKNQNDDYEHKRYMGLYLNVFFHLMKQFEVKPDRKWRKYKMWLRGKQRNNHPDNICYSCMKADFLKIKELEVEERND